MARERKDGAADWAEAMSVDMRGEIERALRALKKAELPDGDVPAVDRHARCVTNLARAVKAVTALAPRNEDEAEMSEDDRGHDPDDPDELERLHRELRGRVERIRANLEAKRREGWVFNPRAPEDGDGDEGSAAAPVRA